jgi:proteic killer suppression protein
MILSFRNRATEDIFNGEDTKKARKVCPRNLWNVARRKLDLVDSATSLDDLRIPPNNPLEDLVDDRQGQYNIRINDQYRICFIWTVNGAKMVEIVDYHSS